MNYLSKEHSRVLDLSLPQRLQLVREVSVQLSNSYSPPIQLIIDLIYYYNINDTLTIQEIANVFGVTRARIRQIEKNAMTKLKYPRISRLTIRPYYKDEDHVDRCPIGPY